MNIVIIQPNWQAVSEVWIQRMQEYIERDIKGVAAFLPLYEDIEAPFELFNLNGRNPTVKERFLIKLKLLKYDRKGIIVKELLAFIKEKKVDIVLIHFLSAAEYISDIFRHIQIPVLVHVHGIDILWDAKDFYNSHNNYYPAQYKINCQQLFQLSNFHFLANSIFSKQQLIEAGANPEKIVLKYFGVPMVDINRNFYKQFLTVLFLGRFVEFKGPELVVEAFFKACDNGFKGDLVMAGDGPLKPFCEMMVSRSKYKNKVRFLGKVNKEEASQLFQQADIYTMHSCRGALTNEVEAFGVSIIEAMSYHLPVITGALGGPVEIITNGVDGILVTPGDTDGHAAALMEIFHNKEYAKLLGNNAAKTIVDKFSPEKEKNILLSTINSLVCNKEY